MASSWDDQDDLDEKTHVFDNERAEGAPSGSERWYISPDGKTKEVLTAAEIIERARSGSLSDSTLIWRDGLTDWTRLDAVPELMQAVIAFRSSSPALGAETGAAGRESAPGTNRASHPLPPVPAPPSLHRAPTSGPLPPPPALPPLPHAPPPSGRATSSDAQEANTIALSVPVGKPREPQPTLSSVASQAGQLIANSSRGALDRASDVVQRLAVLMNQDVNVPKLGAVKGRVLALVGGAATLLIVLLFVLASGGATTETTETDARSAAAPREASGEGVDLDAENAASGGVNEAPVLMGELESLEPVRSKTQKGSAQKLSAGAAVKPAAKGKEFDVLAAKSALSAAAAKAATCTQGPKGEGSVRVKIASTGKVVSVAVTTPEFQGTAAGNCVQQIFRQATVPPFTGDDKTVFKKFVIH